MDHVMDPYLLSERRAILNQLTAGEALEAMRRLREGTYGICVCCGRRIPEARLRARPEATRCIDCQRELERLTVA